MSHANGPIGTRTNIDGRGPWFGGFGNDGLEANNSYELIPFADKLRRDDRDTDGIMTTSLQSERQQTLAEQIAEELAWEIVFRQFAPGDRLKEVELANRFGVGRPLIREVFQQLESEGLVEYAPWRGVRVPVLTHIQLSDFYDLFAISIGFAARLATERATEQQIETLESVVGQLESMVGETYSPWEFQKVRRSAYLAITQATGESTVLFTRRPVVQRLRSQFGIDSVQTKAQRQTVVKHWQKILRHMKKADALAAEAAAKKMISEAKVLALAAHATIHGYDNRPPPGTAAAPFELVTSPKAKAKAPEAQAHQQTLSDQLTEQLGWEITFRKFAPGDRLKEVELAARFGVSRALIREVLQQLEGEGLVEYAPWRGMRVTLLTQTQLADLYDFFGLFLGFAVRVATERATDAQMKAVETVVKRMADAVRDHDTSEAYQKAREEIYGAIVECMGESRDLINRRPIVRRMRNQFSMDAVGTLARRRQSLKRWQKLIRVMKSRDALAAEACVKGMMAEVKVLALEAHAKLHSGQDPVT